jgi:hypothetical protein
VNHPARTALADQAAAAAREALDSFLRTAARHSGSVELAAMSGGRLAMLTRLSERMAEGTTTPCAHYRPRSPEPLVWLAWAPDLLRCAPCHQRAAARMTEAMARMTEAEMAEAGQRCHLCDAADDTLRLVNVLVPATQYSAPLVTWFGLCAACREGS